MVWQIRELYEYRQVMVLSQVYWYVYPFNL